MNTILLISNFNNFNENIYNFLSKLKKDWTDNYNYNFKNSTLFCTLFLNLYPEIAQDMFKLELNIHDKKSIEKKLEKDNKYLDYFNFLFEKAYISYQIHNFNSSKNKFNTGFQNLTYINQKEINYLIFKSSIYHTSNVFEDNVWKILSKLTEYKFQKNVRKGIYEVFYYFFIFINKLD